MALFKRGEVWWVSFTAPNGKRVRESTGITDKEQAEEYHDRLKAEQWRVHRLGEKPKRTWQEAVVRWLNERDDKADHLKDVGKLRWLDPYLSGYFLDQINRDVIDEIACIKKAEASSSTANRYLALIRAILRAARDDWEWIDRCPRIRLYREPKKRVRWLTEEEAVYLLQQLPEHLADMAAFTLATGLRQRNVSYLRWDQVSMERRMAWIHADQSKSRKAIAVPLNTDAMNILRKWLGRHGDFVFVYQGNPVDRTSTKAWYNALERAGIQNFRWHDLRHTWASWHVQRGTSLQELLELGGWSSYEMVLRYAHFAGDHLRGAAENVQGTILAQSGKVVNLRLAGGR